MVKPSDLKSVVIELDSVPLLPVVDGAKFGIISFNSSGVQNPGDVDSSIFVVPPSKSCPVRFFEEYTGFVLSGTGQFLLPNEAHDIKEHSFFVKPRTHETQATIKNTGSSDLKILVFRSRALLRFKERTDRAQEIVSSYIERAWKRNTLNWEGYRYDGRVLAMFYRDLQYILVSDEYGSVYFNGQRIPMTDTDSTNVVVEKIIAAEKDLRLAYEKDRASQSKPNLSTENKSENRRLGQAEV